MRDLATWWLSSWLVLAGAGCAASDSLEPQYDRSCPDDPLSIGGVWEIEAQGTRRDCTNPRLNGPVKVQVDGLVVRARRAEPGCDPSAPKGEGFTDCIRASDIILSSGERTGPDSRTPAFTGLGSESDCRIEFQLTEILNDGDTLAYTFEGHAWKGPSPSPGSFEGTGPEQCELEGTFELVRR